MNGIINVLKPPGMTSFDVVAYLRGVLKTKKIGHTGTLDPEAVGVLPVCVGNATKAIEFITGNKKLYRAELTLGVTTDTQDSCGKVIHTCEAVKDQDHITEVIKSFQGRYLQTPPMFSAVKVEGRKLYELAREGVTIERKPREVHIYFIRPVRFTEPGKVLVDVLCSKGTYIRTLCADIGARLGCGGHMSFLIRLQSGTFSIETALPLEEIAGLSQTGRLAEKILPVDEAFREYRSLTLDDKGTKKIMNGAALPLEKEAFTTGELLRLYSREGVFLALGEISGEGDSLCLKARKLFRVVQNAGNP